jgi:Ca2+-binding RTX toxin-like protein
MPNTKLSTPVAAIAQNNPGGEPRLISAVATDGAAPQFKIPFSSQAIQSVESVDLDLVLTTATGEKIILQQGALQAATQPDSKIVFQNGDSITAADQIKKLGILKPVEGGSFRLKSGDASPAVAEKVTGDAFGLGKELQDTMSQLTETSKQLEKVLQTLTTASLSTTTDDAKPITAGPGTGTGVQKITPQSDKFASPSPGSPPKVEVEEFTSNNTNNNTSNNTDSGNVSNIKITSTLRGLYGAPDAITTHVRAVDKIQSKEQDKEVLKAFSQASLREMLPSDPLQVRISGSTPVALEPDGLAHNTLVMPGVLNAKSIRFELPQDTVLPAGFQIAGQTFSGSRITIAAESLKDLSLAIQWKVADLDASINKTDFQLGVKYLDDKGAELEQGRAPLTFTYGELKTIEDTVQLDANSNTKIFLSAYGYSYDILGDDSNNNIAAGNGNDTLDGGAGADVIAGGAGHDTYKIDNTGDVVIEAANAGADLVKASVSYTLSANVENLTLTGLGDINGTGNALDNTITGNSGINTLDGGAGDDTMIGGAGNDTYIVDITGDVVREESGAESGIDLIKASVTYTLSAHVENLELTGTYNLGGTGNDLNNTITGNSGNNSLDGGAGADTMIGGAGNDTYIVESASDVVDEVANEGTDKVQSSVNYTLGDNLENLTLSGGATSGAGNTSNNVLIANNNGNTLSGLSGDDTLTGGTGKDTLDGGVGIDSMAGGSGDDTYIVDNAKDVVTEVSGVGAGTDKVQSSVNYTLGDNLENLTLSGGATSGAGNGADNIIIGNNAGVMLDGGAGNDNITGGTGNDTLIGGVGSDILTGGGGTDTVSYSASSGAVLVSLATGVGSGGDASDDSLSGITNLIGSSGADTLTGDAGNNYLTGNGSNDTLSGGDGNDTLDGGAGNDSMTGGTGNDTYIVDSTTDAVTEAANAGTDTVQSSVNYTLGRDLENLTLRDTASAGVGNELDNIIIGSNTASNLDGKSGNDSITGGTSNDILTGGLGNDTLDGGVGSDWVDYSAATNNMTVELKASGTSTISFLINTVDQGTDTLSNIENIKTGSGNDAVTATGTATTANTIYSGAGDDTVSGGDGNNTLYGEAGNDNLTAGTGNDTIFGGDGNDVIAGGNGSNALYGEVGNDTLTAGTGNDTIFGGNGNDSITGGGGADSLLAGDGVDTLTGGAGVDTFDLATGNTSLAGDKATSGGAADVFIVNADNLASINSSTLIQGSSAAVDTLQIKATAGATINLTALTNTDNFVSINKVDVATDGFASTVQFNSMSVKNLVDGGNESVLTLALGGSDNYTIMSEQGVYVTDTRASATFYSDAAKTVQIAQVLYV